MLIADAAQKENLTVYYVLNKRNNNSRNNSLGKNTKKNSPSSKII